MADSPFFPPPVPRGPSYREPAARPLTEVAPRPAVTEADTKTTPVVVKRALRDGEVEVAVVAIRSGDEAAFWRRRSFAAEHPRIAGILTLVAGGFLTIAFVAEARGVPFRPHYSVLGPPIAFAGLWFLLVGYPLDARAVLKSWWYWGLGLMVALSLILEVALIATR